MCFLPFNPYDEHADCPEFKDFLGYMCNHDEGVVQFLRAVVHNVVTGRIRGNQVILNVVGVGGPGKITFCTVFSELVGIDSTMSISLKELNNYLFGSTILRALLRDGLSLWRPK